MAKNTTEVNGICTPFNNYIAKDVPGVTEQTGGGSSGGVDIPEGQKQSAPGETGTWPTTTKLPGEMAGGPGTRRPDISGS